MIIETNHLLTISRFPETFYPLIHDLHGRDAQYLNPGFSLRSFVVARCLKKEYTVLPKEMYDVMRECTEFSQSSDILDSVVVELTRRTRKVFESIAALPGHSQEKFIGSVDQLKTIMDEVKRLFDIYSDLGKDPMIEPGYHLKDALFDLNEKILDVSWAVDAEIPPVPEVEDDDPESA